MKPLNGQTLIQAFEHHAPKALAVENDRIGLQVGTLNKTIKRVMITLDVLENVVDEAIEKEVDLIIAHHPVIYRPLKTMRTDQGQSKIVAKCIRHDIAVYVAHTNLDIADPGVNDWLAAPLQLKNTRVLSPTQSDTLLKLAVYVPETHADELREALNEAGAGHIGNYSHCTFNSEGIGTFLPESGTAPFIGAEGRLEQVRELKIETVVPKERWNRVLKAMLKAHPYEEVAYDCYELKNEGKTYGLGRIGELETALRLEDLAHTLKEVYSLGGCRVVGDLNRMIKKVAILGGDGNSLVHEAAFKGADVFITGDIYYHTAHDAMLESLSIIDIGHHAEKVMKQGVKGLLDPFLKEGGYEAEIIISEANTHPFQFV